jgi:hypothetical protein
MGVEEYLDMAEHRLKLARKHFSTPEFVKEQKHIAFMYLGRACEIEQGLYLSGGYIPNV